MTVFAVCLVAPFVINAILMVRIALR